MIILKYGNAKKLESAKRWKCKCSKCGCKVILDKDDIQNYKNDINSDNHHVTKPWLKINRPGYISILEGE